MGGFSKNRQAYNSKRKTEKDMRGERENQKRLKRLEEMKDADLRRQFGRN